MKLHTLLIALVMMVSTPSLMAQANDYEADTTPLRPVTSSYMLKAGSTNQADTYLSPLKYSGWAVGFEYERLQAMRFSPEKWVMRLALGIDGSRAGYRNHSAYLAGVSLKGSWAMMRRWRIDKGFSAGVGGATTLDLGALYSSRNGNNPVNAQASWTIDAAAYASWNGHIGRLPLTARYQTLLPVTGAFFAPDYGELYYEIWLGNHSGLAHPVWWGKWFRWDNLLTVDLHFGGTSLRLGYSGEITTWRVNGLTHRDFRHSFVLGVTTEWISLSPRAKATHKQRIISAQ